MPFTLCLDVTLRVEAAPRAAETARRLTEEFAALGRIPGLWAFRYLGAQADGADLLVSARLLEPVEELYGADPDRDGEHAPADVVLRLLNAHCATWRSADVGDRPLRWSSERVRRRVWTGEGD
ncbi:MAG TPA: hypothetical protein VK501_10880 [Baekduia sp.]|uniref:hypothetical protein n=1 Tax=Baekduia sp. TaxID=2600305 RepID=UPI002B9558B3|nr:hypothetical protein [Baekduia sp.]HMJ34410.1 hypothetical protein [Baekduia sp.]